MQVREATVDDCGALAERVQVVVAEGRWLLMESTTTAEMTDRFRTAVTAADHHLFVLEEDGEPIGALGLHPTMAKGVHSLGMWVLPEWRGKGGGRLLMEAALAARPPGVHKIEIEVFPDNEAAIGLYRSFGFEQEGLRRDHHRRQDGSLRSALLMARLFDTEG